ncbi:MAG: hypothetical protein CJBNEKGG_03417 [Prosthecobacter sp.]|nr:hypothetical protein [Prosthecobacter sp.]
MKTLTLAMSLLLPLVLLAAPPPDPNQRLRDTLKNTMLQLRAAETERAGLQAAHLVDEAKIKELGAKVEELNQKIVKMTKDANEEQEAARKEIDLLKNAKEAQSGQIARLQEALEKWKTGYNEVVKVARERETLRAKAVSKAVLAERRLAERERQNLELYVTGREILDRLAGFSLGTALTAREPFVGTTRVKLQNLVQDYGDRLQDNKYNPFAEKAAEAQKPEVTKTAAPGDASTKESPGRP